MSRRTKMILLIIGGILVISLLIWFVMRPQLPAIREGANLNAPTLPPAGTTVSPVSNINTAPIVEEEPEIDAAVAVKSLASLFAERYSSFSNQTNFKNLEDLSLLMTTDMAKTNDKYIKEQREKNQDSSVYYGVSSKAVKNKLISLDEKETAAEVQLTLQRREARGSMNSNVKVFYQDIVVRLKKERGEWRVDGVEWREK